MEEMQGVMALPQVQGMGISPGDMQVLQQIRQNIPRQEVTQEFLSAGEQIDPQAVAAFKEELAALDLDKQSLDKLNEMVDTILAAPQDYASLRRAYLEEGFPEEVLPEQFDPGFFAALNMAIDVMIMNQGSRPPMAMARGGIADLAAYGRYGDTMLAHITPEEAALLQQMGGSGTINPVTGLPEFFIKWAAEKVKSAVKSVGNAVKKFAQSTVGKIIIGAGLAIFGGPLAAGFLSGAAGSAGLSGLSSFLVSKVGMAAVGGFLAGAGTTLASGGNLKQALRAGAIGAVGAGAFTGVAGAIQGASASDLFSAPPTPTDVVSTGAGQGGTSTTVRSLDPTLGAKNLAQAAQESANPVVEVGAPFAPRIEAAPMAPRIEAAPLPDQIAMLEANMAPQGYSSGYEMGLRQGPPPGAGAAELADYGRRHAMATMFNPSPDANLVQDVLGSRTSPMGLNAAPSTSPLDAAPSTSPLDAAPRMGGNTQYSPNAARSLPSSSGSSSGGGGSKGIMDLIREGEYGKAAGAAYDRIMPEALGGERGAVTPEMINDMRSKAQDIITAKDPSFALKAQTDPAAKAIFDKLVTDQATKLATPSMLSTYGPLAALGVGALGLSGGFKTKDAEKPEEFQGPTGYQKYYMNPSIYGLEFGGIRPTSFGDRYAFTGYAEGGGVMGTPQAMRVGGKTYPRKVGSINGPGTGTSDSIPAMLSDGEFVFTAKAVRAMGNGSRRKGAKKMYQLMKMLEGKST